MDEIIPGIIAIVFFGLMGCLAAIVCCCMWMMVKYIEMFITWLRLTSRKVDESSFVDVEMMPLQSIVPSKRRIFN